MRAKSLLKTVVSFAEKSENVASMNELSAAVMAIVGPLGYVAASGRLGHPGPPEAFHFATWNPAWWDLYLRNGFIRFDPVPIWAVRSGSAVTGGELRAMLPRGHPGLKVLDAAIPFGYRGGYFLPQRASDNTFGVVAFVGAGDPQSHEERAALRALAGISFERAEALSGRPRPSMVPPAPPALTAKERDCLKYLAGGKTATQISRLMKVSEATVRFHIANLRTKIGASSLAELTVSAIALGLIPSR